MEIKIDISNFKILADFYGELSKVDQTKIWMSAYRKASVPLLSVARSNVPKKGYGLYNSLGTIARPERNAIEIGSRTNTRHTLYRKGKSSIGKVWYAHLLEWGTVARSWKARRGHKSKNTGTVSATHFFENAWNSTHTQVENSITKEWFNAINNFITKTNRKIKR
jgi:hypothetical protein